MKCDKHDCSFIFKELEHGKTIEVCPECDREDHMRVERHFRELGIKSLCPLCGQEIPK